jgi:hypothetical protein
VKEFISCRKDSFGLRRTGTVGNGSIYLLTAGISYNEKWADDLALDIFEYARLANLEDVPRVQDDLDDALDILGGVIQGQLRDKTRSAAVSRLEWLVQEKDIPFWNGLKEDVFKFGQFGPYILLLSLAIATSLSSFVKREVTN